MSMRVIFTETKNHMAISCVCVYDAAFGYAATRGDGNGQL